MAKKKQKTKKEEKVKITKVDETVFDSGLEVHDDCPYRKAKIIVSPKVWRAIIQLIARFRDDEWILDLYGKRDDDNNEIRVEDFRIPRQEVSGATCERKENPEPRIGDNEFLGMIHSHNTMAASFSGEDKKTALNYGMLGVVNNKLDCKFLIRKTMPCGALIVFETENVGWDVEGLDVSNIKKKTYAYSWKKSTSKTTKSTKRVVEKKDDDIYDDEIYDAVIDEIETKRLCEYYDSGHCRLEGTYCPFGGQKSYCGYYSENVAQDTRW